MTYLEIANPDAPRGQVRTAVFDFDGTLSLIREGWQNVMTPYFVEVISSCPDAEDTATIENLVREFITRLTGKQTIYQCFQLQEEVKKRGGTPLDALEYKHEYLRRLWMRIEHRVNALRAGEAKPEDYLLSGSREFLQALADRGVELVLASGTDLVYVQDEAEALNVAHFFGRHIYAAVDEYRNFSKQMIIDRMLQENNLHGPELMVVGDGYVEIENGKGVGGLAVGVACDEAAPGNIDNWKRERLLQAGADCIVPDYSDLNALIRYIFPHH
jgi:phosphoglycolate phosphatase-like HAD superfamily hydrolase